MSRDLLWSSHIEKACNDARRKTFLFVKVFSKPSEDIAVKLLKTTYRVLHEDFSVDLSDIFELSENVHLGGHSLKLSRERFYTACRESFFPNWVFEVWCSLSEEVVRAPSVNYFKNGLDRFLSTQ
ncbi:hypothetical protein HHI36_012560 [Cryptolaemus montrouzieri]|uniref:Uncharacterized protein n=1 Tax=Cryptolaemus montrouzieri TaxID=559131 RepID=A0ABD2NFA1_9CUCU